MWSTSGQRPEVINNGQALYTLGDKVSGEGI